MFIVVVYDITDNKRRTRLHKALSRFGEPVQLSVFECILTEAQFGEMRKAADQAVGDESVNIRYYDICKDCHRRLITFGRAITTRIESVYIA